MRLCKLIFFLLFASPFFAAAQGYVVIHEVLADNANRNSEANEVNEFGHESDWLELYNPSGDDVDLYGRMIVKGNITNTVRFIFTNSVIMPPDTYFRLWCDKDNTNATGITQYHTGFALEKSGDTVLLVAPDGVAEEDRITFGLQLADFSLGRDPDWHYYWGLCIPTPVPADWPSMAEPNQPAQMGDPYQLKINEWCPTNWDWWIEIINHPNDTNATNCGHCHEDWIEVYNPNAYPVALSWGPDLSLILSTNQPDTASVSAGFWPFSYIEPYGYQRFWAVGDRRTLQSDEVGVKLSHRSGEWVTLCDYDRWTVIDTVTVPAQGAVNWVYTNSVAGGRTNLTWYAQGRLPDGDTNIGLFPVILTNNNLTTDRSTPGDSNFLPLTNGVYINEVLAHTDPPLQDAVEFWNSSSNTVYLDNYWLSNARNTPKKYRFPAGFSIPPGGYRVVYEYQFNPDFTGSNTFFTFNSAQGDQCYLYSGDTNGNLTGYRRSLDFGASFNGVSFGRYTNSEGDIQFVAMSALTFGSSITATSPTNAASSNAFVNGLGTNNSYPMVGPLVISEIMYHPPDRLVGTNIVDNSDDEYMELYNMSTNTVYLYLDAAWQANAWTNRWRIHRTIDYTWPTNQALNSALAMPPGGFMLLLNFDPRGIDSTNMQKMANFRAVYTNLPPGFTNMYGPYKGKLANTGGTIEMNRPDIRQMPPHPDAGYVPQVLVEQVRYNDKAPWPTNADGLGFALQRCFPQGFGDDPTNWVAVTPTPGSLGPARFESVTRSNNTVRMTFYAWANSTYSLQRSATLGGSWITVSNFPAQPTFSLRQASDVVTPGEKRFYRITRP